jgi:hypothetical protein
LGGNRWNHLARGQETTQRDIEGALMFEVNQTDDTDGLPREGNPVAVKIKASLYDHRYSDTFSVWDAEKGEWLKTIKGYRRCWRTKKKANQAVSKLIETGKVPRRF